MRLEFSGRIKQVALKLPKPTEDEPIPSPVTIFQVEADLSDKEVGKLAGMMRLGVEIAVRTDQLSFAAEPDGNSGARFIPEACEGLDNHTTEEGDEA